MNFYKDFWINSTSTGTECNVKCGERMFGSFPMNSGMKMGNVLALALFNTNMNWKISRVII